MKKCVNGVYVEMSEEEIKAWKKAQEQAEEELEDAGG